MLIAYKMMGEYLERMNIWDFKDLDISNLRRKYLQLKISIWLSFVSSKT